MSFSPTNLAQSLTGNNSKKRINIKFVFKYKYKNQNNSPAIILEDRIGNSLSSFPHEYDVFLFPFTFARINNIKSDEQNIKIIEMEIINRTSYIEYDLKNNIPTGEYLIQLDRYQK